MARGEPLGRAHGLPVVIKDVMKVAGLTCSGVAVESARGRDGGISPPTDDVATVVVRNTPGCVGRTMELLWESVVLGGDRGGGFEQDLQAIGATDPSEELAEFLRQAREVDFSLSEARRRFVAIDEYRIEMLTFMADYDVIICPAMPTPASRTTTAWWRSTTSHT